MSEHGGNANHRREFLKGVGLAGAGLMGGVAGCLGGDGGGGDYPSEPITAIVPWGAGGGTDTTTRNFKPYFEEEIGVELVPENRAGASSRQGMNHFSQQEPDGYTIAVNDTIINIAAAALYETQFDPFTLVPIGNMEASFSGFFIEPGTYAGWDEVRADLEDPNSDTKLATSGRGSATDVHVEDYFERLGIPPENYTTVPVDSGAQAAQAPASPDADVGAAIVSPSTAGFVEDGLVECVFHFQDTPESALVPEAETLQTIDADLPEWPFAPAMWGPEGLDEEKQTTLDEARGRATQHEEYQQYCDENGLVVQNLDAEGLADLLDSLSDIPEVYSGRIEGQ